jgi:catechol 2,3-dioxygenase-like lactoylglutathione lyase family enzyme
MDYRIELIHLNVSDVDASIAFYVDQCGFNLDHDHRVSDEIRFVQITPPGSACSIALVTGQGERTPAKPASVQVVVDDADAGRAELAERGVEASEVQDFPWGRFVFFSDPDGNLWSLQQPVQPRG